MKHFQLHWYNERTGRDFETDYFYTGEMEQKNFTFHGWVCHCIAAGKREGLMYLGKDRLVPAD